MGCAGGEAHVSPFSAGELTTVSDTVIYQYHAKPALNGSQWC